MKSLCLLSLVLGLAGNAAAGIRYDVIDLGALAGSSCDARAINNSGEVAGRFYTGGNDGHWHAFVYSHSTFTDLGTLGGQESYAVDINDSGLILGKAEDAGFASHVVTWSQGVATDLGVMGGAWPTAMNNSGDFVGTMPVSGAYHPFLYHAGGTTDLSASIGSANIFLKDINDAGTIVGGGMYVGNSSHGFVYSGGTATDINTILGLPSTALSIVSAVNASGAMAGDAEFSGKYQPFLYSGGATTLIDPSHGNSFAESINSSGQIVGEYDGSRSKEAFLFENGAVLRLQDLISPSLPYRLYFATAINDSGWILCSNYKSAYLLVPLASGAKPPTLEPLRAKRIVVSRPQLRLSGKARGTVTSVSYRIGKRVYHIAEGTNQWKLKIGLKGIKRTSLTIVAHGPGGDSLPVRVPVLVQ